MADITFRPAEPSDDPALSALAGRLAGFAVPPWRSAAEITDADARAMLDAVARGSPDDQVFVAERGGACVGCLHVLATRDFFGRAHAHISVIAVSSTAEGTGVGAALMRFAESWGRARRLPFITLNVFAANSRARRLYEKAGFVEEAVRYAKALDPGAAPR